MADPTDDSLSMVSITTSTGHAKGDPVVYVAWIVPRDTADMMMEKLTGILGPPQVEIVSTVGGAMDSYQRAVQEGAAVYFAPGRGDE